MVEPINPLNATDGGHLEKAEEVQPIGREPLPTIPILSPPTVPLRVPYYWVTSHQLELLQTHVRGKNESLVWVSTAAGIFATSLGTLFTLGDGKSTAFAVFLGITIAALVVGLLFVKMWWTGRVASSRVFEDITSQHRES
jgi:hypothetical protein